MIPALGGRQGWGQGASSEQLHATETPRPAHLRECSACTQGAPPHVCPQGSLAAHHAAGGVGGTACETREVGMAGAAELQEGREIVEGRE